MHPGNQNHRGAHQCVSHKIHAPLLRVQAVLWCVLRPKLTKTKQCIPAAGATGRAPARVARQPRLAAYIASGHVVRVEAQHNDVAGAQRRRPPVHCVAAHHARQHRACIDARVGVYGSPR